MKQGRVKLKFQLSSIYNKHTPPTYIMDLDSGARPKRPACPDGYRYKIHRRSKPTPGFHLSRSKTKGGYTKTVRAKKRPLPAALALWNALCKKHRKDEDPVIPQRDMQYYADVKGHYEQLLPELKMELEGKKGLEAEALLRAFLVYV